MAKLHRTVSEALYRLHTLPSPSKPIFHRTISSNTFRATHNSATPLRNTFRSFSSSIFPYGISNSSKTTTNPKLIFTQICRHSTNSTSLSQKISSFSSKNLGFTSKLKFDPLGFKRHFSKLDGSVVEKPVSAVKSVFSRYRHAIGLQIEAFWKRNYLFLVGAGAVGVCLVLWRLMFGIANSFVGLSEGMAKYGFLALSSAIVAFAGIYIRSRFTINPDRVYRIAMRKLNTSASILEVMGAPLSGTDVRAYVMSGGGLTLKNFKLKLSSKRCFLIFPIQGSERKGLVSVEVKKKKGQYDMKLLAVDIPMMVGADQRFFLEGDEDEYKIGGGLIGVLRDPIVKAMAAQKEFEALDQKEEEEDEEKEREDAERKHREEMEKLEKSSQ